jgi:hypothetical protein
LSLREKELADARATLTLLEAGTRPEEIEAERACLARLQEEARYLKGVQERLPIQSPVTPRLKERFMQYVREGDVPSASLQAAWTASRRRPRGATCKAPCSSIAGPRPPPPLSGARGSRGYTWAEAGYRITQPSDRFLLASRSKMFLEAAVQSLYDAKKLTPDTKVYPLLGFSHPADPRSDTITIQQHLDHMGGYDDDPYSTTSAQPIAGRVCQALRLDHWQRRLRRRAPRRTSRDCNGEPAAP